MLQDDLEGFFKPKLPGPLYRVFDLVDLGWGLCLHILTSFQVTLLLLLLWEPHFKDYWFRALLSYLQTNKPSCGNNTWIFFYFIVLIRVHIIKHLFNGTNFSKCCGGFCLVCFYFCFLFCSFYSILGKNKGGLWIFFSDNDNSADITGMWLVLGSSSSP